MNTATRIITIIAALMISISAFATTSNAPETVLLPGDCSTGWGATDEDSISNVETYSLYYEYFKQKAYDDAWPYWEKLYASAPGATKSTFVNGERMIKAFEDKAETADKQKWMDQLMSLYEERIACFGEESYVSLKKARILYDKKDLPGAYTLYNTHINNIKDDITYLDIKYYFRTMFDRYADKEITQQEGFEIYSNASNISAEKIAAGDKYAEKYQEVSDYMEEKIAALNWFTSCDDITRIYGEKYRNSTKDKSAVSRYLNKLKNANCTSHPDYSELTARWTALNPVKAPVAGSGTLINAAMSSGNYAEVVRLYDERVATQSGYEKSETLMKQAKIYFKYADEMGGKSTAFKMARSKAEEAAGLNPSSGAPHMLVGDLYRSSGPLCGSGTGWNSQIVSYIAIDEYNKAKQKDSSVASTADSRIKDCYKYLPTKDVLFMKGKSKGQSVSIGCWIGKSTTIK